MSKPVLSKSKQVAGRIRNPTSDLGPRHIMLQSSFFFCKLFNVNKNEESRVFPVFIDLILHIMGRDSSVDIATRYGLDGLGIESR